MMPLERLYKTKLALLAALTTVAGVVLLVLARWVAVNGPGWLQALPITEVGGALFSTGLVAIFFGYIDRKDTAAREIERTRMVIAEQVPAMFDAAIEGFAFKADDIARVASPAVLDRLTRNALGLQLQDQQLADDVYTDLRKQVIRSGERWHDLDISVDLTPWKQGPASGKGSMFVATVRREYRVTPANPTMRFTCISDFSEYREQIQDPSSTLAWYFRPVGKLTAASDGVFELVQFTVDGKERPIRHSQRSNGQSFSVNLGIAREQDAGSPASSSPREVTISYTYRVLVQRDGHLLWLSLAKPTKGLKIQLRYGGCGIKYVNVVDFIASAQPTHVNKTPEAVPTPAVDVNFEGWVFPGSGVAFVWVLAEGLTSRDTAASLASSEDFTAG